MAAAADCAGENRPRKRAGGFPWRDRGKDDQLSRPGAVGGETRYSNDSRWARTPFEGHIESALDPRAWALGVVMDARQRGREPH